MSVAPFLYFYQRAQQVGVLAYHIEVNGTRCGTATNGNINSGVRLLSASELHLTLSSSASSFGSHAAASSTNFDRRDSTIAHRCYPFWSAERY
jgi:hypothetical protein